MPIAIPEERSGATVRRIDHPLRRLKIARPVKPFLGAVDELNRLC
jgi:hypothetical protein